MRAVAEALARDPGAVARLAGLSDAQRGLAAGNWLALARVGQLPPEGNWRIWLIMAGRGFGKTRAGAEWVQLRAMLGGRGTHIALVGATINEARSVMVEGVSGVLNIAPAGERPRWEPSRGRLIWPNGARATLYSGAQPEGLRGPEHGFAWCDEIAKWAYPAAAWTNLQMGLRQGERPRAVVTTTPRAGPFLTGLRAGAGLVETRGRTRDNNVLPPAFVADMEAEYGGTRLGRQELDGELIADAEGALWTRDLIEKCRLQPGEAMPGWDRVVIGVDPPAGSVDGKGDACGIMVVGISDRDTAVVLADASVNSGQPHVWAAAVAEAAAHWGADRVVAEANNGGEMVTAVLHAADAGLPVKLVHASRGKAARAEPVALKYEAGKVRHAQAFPDLEDQLCGMIIGGGYEGPGRSPDRADALVWAVTEGLLSKAPVVPRIRSLAPDRGPHWWTHRD